MKLSENVKSISYLKAKAADIIRKFDRSSQTLVITQNGEAKAVLQDIKSYEEMRESLAFLKLLAQSSESLQKGDYQPLTEAFSDIRKRAKPTLSYK